MSPDPQRRHEGGPAPGFGLRGRPRALRGTTRWLRTTAAALLLPALLALFLVPAMPAAAAEGELQRLQGLLSALNQQLQGLYQEFQMVEAARRTDLASAYAVRQGLDTRGYDEIVAERERALRQERSLGERETRLLAEMRQIDARKQPLLDRIAQLATAAPQAGRQR
jgi:hypothetical protein